MYIDTLEIKLKNSNIFRIHYNSTIENIKNEIHANAVYNNDTIKIKEPPISNPFEDLEDVIVAGYRDSYLRTLSKYIISDDIIIDFNYNIITLRLNKPLEKYDDIIKIISETNNSLSIANYINILNMTYEKQTVYDTERLEDIPTIFQNVSQHIIQAIEFYDNCIEIVLTHQY